MRRLIDIGRTTDGLPFLVLEYLDGDSLEELLERSGGLLRIGEALRITTCVLEVRAAGHAVGVLHRGLHRAVDRVVRRGGDTKAWLRAIVADLLRSSVLRGDELRRHAVAMHR